jgi:hypothetical protein
MNNEDAAGLRVVAETAEDRVGLDDIHVSVP